MKKIICVWVYSSLLTALATDLSAPFKHEVRVRELGQFIQDCRTAGQTGEKAWIGEASSLVKVRPYTGVPFQAAKTFSLSLVRGETESFQVIVIPTVTNLTSVHVDVSDLVCKGAHATLPARALRASPMGYVKTTRAVPYGEGYNVTTNLPGGYFRLKRPVSKGWWPDPILDHLTCADIAQNVAQSFWVRVRCPAQQGAGIYQGTLRVCAGNWTQEFPLSVRVYNFSVPAQSPLPLSITFRPAPSPTSQWQNATESIETCTHSKKLRTDPNAPINLWKKHITQWGDFLADYYITMDNLYFGDKSQIQWDVLLRLKEQGRLGLFNLAYWSYPRKFDDASQKKWRQTFISSRLKPCYDKAKALGLLSHAYIYGCDEVQKEFFPNIKWALTELRKAFPGVPISTTAADEQFGVGTDLAQIDWFTPQTNVYDDNFTNVAPARKAGHQVWWYIACCQRAPLANIYVDNSAIEVRQLMGAQTIKYRPDGFLYYQVSIWNAERPISGSSTFTDWNPRSWTSFHGDGSLVCAGPDATPCATIRLENFRDGLEDYAYAKEYERVTGKPCVVPACVCRSTSQFSDGPAVYLAWRAKLAEEIERAQTSH